MADRFRTDIDWEDVRVFVALARHGSLSATARALSVNHATVARRLASLERALGDTLAERRPDGYVLTPAGERILEAAQTMEAAAASLNRGSAAGGLVRVNATPSMVQHFLAARLAAFARPHPGIDIELAGDVRPVSLERSEADLALRLGRPEDGDFIAKRLAVLGFGFYAAEMWAARLSEGEPPQFLGFDEANAHLPEAVWLKRSFPRHRPGLRLPSQSAQATAARAGAGIALLPHFIGRGVTGLSLCDLGKIPPPRELWLIRRRDAAKLAVVRPVADFLTAVYAAERALFE